MVAQPASSPLDNVTDDRLDYLSDGWLDAADALLRSQSVTLEGIEDAFTIATVVEGAPAALDASDEGNGSSARRYVVRLASDELSLDRDGDAADVELTQSWETAVAIASGERSAQAAFLAGEIRVGGDVAALIANASVLGGLGDVLRPLRDRTRFRAG